MNHYYQLNTFLTYQIFAPLYKSNTQIQWEIGSDLTQSYYKSAYTDSKIQKATSQHKNATKNFAQRLRTELGRSVGVKIATQPVKPVYEIPTFPLTAKAV